MQEAMVRMLLGQPVVAADPQQAPLRTVELAPIKAVALLQRVAAMAVMVGMPGS